MVFSSIIGNEEESSHYELHIAVKDYCFGRDDRLIGVSVLRDGPTAVDEKQQGSTTNKGRVTSSHERFSRREPGGGSRGEESGVTPETALRSEHQSAG